MYITEGVKTETGRSSVRDPSKEGIAELLGRWAGLSLNPFRFSPGVFSTKLSFLHVSFLP